MLQETTNAAAATGGNAAAALTQRLEDRIGEKLGLKGPASAASGTSPQDVLRDKLKGLFK